ncbi:hypothetical protein RhiirA4_551523, partial [Rhizophagus irregularis]
MTLIEFVNDIKKCKVQRNILSSKFFFYIKIYICFLLTLIEAQIEGISNELASSKIQDQMNDIE